MGFQVLKPVNPPDPPPPPDHRAPSPAPSLRLPTRLGAAGLGRGAAALEDAPGTGHRAAPRDRAAGRSGAERSGLGGGRLHERRCWRMGRSGECRVFSLFDGEGWFCPENSTLFACSVCLLAGSRACLFVCRVEFRDGQVRTGRFATKSNGANGRFLPLASLERQALFSRRSFGAGNEFLGWHELGIGRSLTLGA